MSDINNYNHQWYLKNKERILKQRKEWYLKNREHAIEYQKEYRRKKMNNDYNFRMSIVYYQSKYYQNKKNKLKSDILRIDCNSQKIINIDIDDTVVQF